MNKIINKTQYDEDNIYYNIDIINNIFPSEGPENIKASFYESRDEVLLSNPNDYELSVIRFKISQNVLPISNIPIQPFPNVNPLLSSYSVTLDHNGDISQVYLIAIPPSTTMTPPSIPTAQNPNWEINGYTFIYEYDIFVDMVNTALETAFNNLLAPPSNSERPIFYFDRFNQLFGFKVKKSIYDMSLPDSDRIDIYFNTYLNDICLGAFNEQKVSNGFDANGMDFILRVSSNSRTTDFTPYNITGTVAIQAAPVTIVFPSSHGFAAGDYVDIINSNSTPSVNGNWRIISTTPASITIDNGFAITVAATSAFVMRSASYYQIEQSFSKLYTMAFVKNIYFTTNSIPVANEYIKKTISDTFSSGNVSYEKIITDLEPAYVGAADNRGNLIYNPTAEYRMINLKSQTPLRSIDVNVRYRSNSGETYQLFLSRGQTCSIKLLFRSRKFAQLKHL